MAAAESTFEHVDRVSTNAALGLRNSHSVSTSSSRHQDRKSYSLRCKLRGSTLGSDHELHTTAMADRTTTANCPVGICRYTWSISCLAAYRSGGCRVSFGTRQ